MRLAAIVQMPQLHPHPLSKPAVHHHHYMEPVMYDSDFKPGYLGQKMHASPSAKQSSIRLLPATSKLHEQSQISDVVKKCREMG